MLTMNSKYFDFFKSLSSVNKECIVFPGHIKKDGYGSCWFKGKHWYAHRVSFTLHVKEIPIGMDVCHTCDNPSCVNPNHLFLGTHKDNMQDKVRKGRHRYGIPTRKAVGESHGMAKLTKDQVELIKNELGTYTDIAKKYSVSRYCISRIINGKNWISRGMIHKDDERGI